MHLGIPAARKSGLSDVAASIAELLGQLVNHVFEYHRVDVLPQQVDEEPVAHVALADDDLDAFALDAAITHPQHEGAHVRAEDDRHAVHQHEEGEGAQEEEPEPDENVDFLIDNIERQDAEGIVLLNVARRSELVEGAFGHAWEDVDHGVDAILLIPVGERHDLDAVCEKCAVEETIEQHHLTFEEITIW